MSKGARSAIDAAYRELFSAKRDERESWEIIATWQDMQGDERSQAIVAGALLEQALEHALSSHFSLRVEDVPKFFSAQDTSLNFHTKIKLAEALGIIEHDVIGKEMVLIKNVRNAFAHARQHLDFADIAIARYCGMLELPNIVRWGGIIGPKPDTPKRIFATSIRLIYAYLAGARVNKLIRTPLRFEMDDYYCLAFLGRPTRIALAAAAVSRKSGKKSPHTKDQES
jgi:hypothetical protein